MIESFDWSRGVAMRALSAAWTWGHALVAVCAHILAVEKC